MSFNKRIKAFIPYLVSFIVNILYGFFISFMNVMEILFTKNSSIYNLNNKSEFEVFLNVCMSFLGMILINLIIGFIFRNHEAIHKKSYWAINIILSILPYLVYLVFYLVNVFYLIHYFFSMP